MSLTSTSYPEKFHQFLTCFSGLRNGFSSRIVKVTLNHFLSPSGKMKLYVGFSVKSLHTEHCFICGLGGVPVATVSLSLLILCGPSVLLFCGSCSMIPKLFFSRNFSIFKCVLSVSVEGGMFWDFTCQHFRPAISIYISVISYILKISITLPSNHPLACF